MSVYLNSIIGITAMLGTRTYKESSYTRWGVDDAKSITVPKMDDLLISKLVKVYDKYGKKELKSIIDYSNARKGLDMEVAAALDISESMATMAQSEVIKEPMFTMKRYGSNAGGTGAEIQQ